MYTLFILFFASLIGIIVMISRKLAYVRNEEILGREDVLHPFEPHIEKIKNITAKSAKAYGYMALVETIRLYIKSSNLMKQKFKETKGTVKNLINKTTNGGTVNSEGVQEDNIFLKKVTEYKKKIRQIKHKVRREEEKKQ